MTAIFAPPRLGQRAVPPLERRTPIIRQTLAAAAPDGRVVAQPRVIEAMVRRGLAVRVSRIVATLTEAGRREAEELRGNATLETT